ncbi:unnamed protein product [Didymodactylos carnosus]|uniref:HECT-type E3 ubiquitin transferase n=1 Tax=Didymodactylos carnosus TaxID=1234261 RepID=A0A813UYW1_9BILA|nr:unnamed protein product [Didymodactylos carnosus]CAF0850102.1 unnamed protein product [Didymodactylos carnosus]CAF3621407.1 unnamed protein product [Didymodactylos carnosus]CAF3635338.1 unnamed protein product [Didymodactylos carnosus]
MLNGVRSLSYRVSAPAEHQLSQLRIKILNVKLPSSTKLVDVCVILEVDSKYSYRTEIIKKKHRPLSQITSSSTSNATMSTVLNSTSPSISATSNTSSHPTVNVNESFDVLVTNNSKILLKVIAPTRLFGTNDIGQVKFDIKTILNEYQMKRHTFQETSPPSYKTELPLENSSRRTADHLNNSGTSTTASERGSIEILLHGAILNESENTTNNSNETAHIENNTLLNNTRSLSICQQDHPQNSLTTSNRQLLTSLENHSIPTESAVLNSPIRHPQNQSSSADASQPSRRSILLKQPSARDVDTGTASPRRGSGSSSSDAVSGSTRSRRHHHLPLSRPTSNTPVTSSNLPVPATTADASSISSVTPAQLARIKETLPQGWEIRLDSQNRPYYVDHNTRTTTWLRENVLPPGWERRVDARGRVYYVDHNTRTTTWTPPTALHLQNVAHWQNQYARSHSMFNQFEHRFLPPTAGTGAIAISGSENPLENAAPAITEEDIPLPQGWQQMFDIQGRQYFINHLSKTTQWEDPRKMNTGDQLLSGWEMIYTKEGQPYFVDHNTKTTTLQDPRLSGLDASNSRHGSRIPLYQRSLPFKIEQFRYLCNTNISSGQLRLTIRREHLFYDSYTHIMHCQSSELRRHLYIVFKGEEGLDYGGVAREWFFRLSHEVLNPMYCLFEYANKNNYYLQINPASSINPDHLSYFRFIGRFVAMALYHGKFIDNGFSMPFYKRMLGKKLTILDLESLDPDFYNSLTWIKNNNLSENDDLELYFNSSYELLGKVEYEELKPGGNEIKLTEENKEEYIELLTQWRFKRSVEPQTKAFLLGFNEVVPSQWIQTFDEREIELLLCGISKIDVGDWERNAIYKHFTESSKQVQWFWQFVREITDEQRSRLLQFVTGTCRVPIGGFAELLGSNGPQKFCIERFGKETMLPRSHTCFNRLDLPPYKRYDQLKEKLLYAIEECEGFGQE